MLKCQRAASGHFVNLRTLLGRRRFDLVITIAEDVRERRRARRFCVFFTIDADAHETETDTGELIAEWNGATGEERVSIRRRVGGAERVQTARRCQSARYTAVDFSTPECYRFFRSAPLVPTRCVSFPAVRMATLTGESIS